MMMRGSAALCAVAVVTLLMVAGPAIADTYTVNSTADDVDAAPGNGVCATSTGACTLRAAVQEANLHPGADVVTLPAGIFLLALPGPGEDAAATGDLDVLQPLDINGAGRESTIIDGLKSDRILHSLTTALAVRDLTLRHGAPGNPGGAVLAATGTLTIERVRFEGNSSTDGGAVLAMDALTISDSVFDRNVATGTGGAVLLTGAGSFTVTGTVFSSNQGPVGGAIASATTGVATITSCSFSKNLATIFGGLSVSGASAFSMTGSTFDGNRGVSNVGAFGYTGPGGASVTDTKVLGNLSPMLQGGYLVAGGAVNVSGSEFSDNVGFRGPGGLQVIAGTTATLENLQFHRNSAPLGSGGGGLGVNSPTVSLTDVEASGNAGGSGGGIQILGTTVTLTRVRVLDNSSALTAGGGVYVTGTSISIIDSTIDGNVGVLGGGLLCTGTFTITNSTVSNNRAASPGANGAGAYLVGAAGSVITNSTISNNAAEGMGGGAFVTGDVTMRNVTLADNVAPMGSALFNSGGTLTLGSSIVAGSAASHCAGTAITSGDFNLDSNGTCGLAGGNDRNNTDPQLGPLADNGGPTFTHLPAASSPAIDTGNPSACPATDQRGQARPTDGNGDGSPVCDVGAVEFLDLCPTDPAKTLPGICGCGVADTDAALPNGVPDCLINGELKARLARAKTIVAGLTGDASETAVEAELLDIANGLGSYVKQFKAQLVLTDPKAKLDKLAKKTKKPVKKVTRAKAGKKLDKAKTKATAALDNLDRAVAPQ